MPTAFSANKQTAEVVLPLRLQYISISLFDTTHQTRGSSWWRPRKCFILENSIQANAATMTALPTSISISATVNPRDVAMVTVSMAHLRAVFQSRIAISVNSLY
jgi:hypothetical protein